MGKSRLECNLMHLRPASLTLCKREYMCFSRVFILKTRVPLLSIFGKIKKQGYISVRHDDDDDDKLLLQCL